MGATRVNDDALRSELRKQLKQKYMEQDQEINLHQRASVRIDSEIYDLKLRLSQIDRESVEEERNSVSKPIRPASFRKSAGMCINPKCQKRIHIGQPAVKFGHYGLCCNWKCFSEALVSKT
ncbi:hypothetical protein [Paenibacillus rhizophilus]|uniref:Uncharacterized protein n=1 Tax=Paenibacillus rhizophilus TaxID=1850366 RepID=A0A3N9PXL3_9BACL|nr:hypothetical protein [Paenibacillus rhizophilus]RQW09936.1 hypothetical protein EH198_17805 [Paenibacillus rhizophilus]